MMFAARAGAAVDDNYSTSCARYNAAILSDVISACEVVSDVISACEVVSDVISACETSLTSLVLITLITSFILSSEKSWNFGISNSEILCMFGHQKCMFRDHK